MLMVEPGYVPGAGTPPGGGAGPADLQSQVPGPIAGMPGGPIGGSDPGPGSGNIPPPVQEPTLSSLVARDTSWSRNSGGGALVISSSQPGVATASIDVRWWMVLVHVQQMILDSTTDDGPFCCFFFIPIITSLCPPF